jgi:VCBS repeat protein
MSMKQFPGNLRQFGPSVLALGIAVLGVVVVPNVLGHVPRAGAVSAVGGQVTQTEVLARARNWYDRRNSLRYDNSRRHLATDVDGAHRYGQDCSGFVSMAWHLKPGGSGGPNTRTLPNYARTIARQELQPGDLLDDVRDGHAILFEAWERDHVHFSYYSFGSNPIKHITHFTFAAKTMSGHPTAHYQAYRYTKIVAPPRPKPPTPAPAPVVDPSMSTGARGDFNGDGRSDVAAMYNYPGSRSRLFVFTAKADGKFDNPVSWWDSGAGNWDAGRSKLVTGDFNKDGKTDIGVFYSYPGNRTALFTFTSAGSRFNAPVKVWDSGTGNWDLARSKPVSGDFNGDGYGDTAVFYGYSGSRTALFVWTAKPAGGFTGPAKVWDSGAGNWDQPRSHPVTGDFTGDHRTDIAVLYDYPGTRSRLWVFTAKPAGGFNNPASWWDSGAGNWAASQSKVIAGDFNTDGRSDVGIFYNYPRSRTALFTVTSTGTRFLWPVKVWDSGAGNWAQTASKPISGDFNGDGRGDAAVLYQYPGSRTALWVFLANNPTRVWDSGTGNWDQPRTNPI